MGCFVCVITIFFSTTASFIVLTLKLDFLGFFLTIYLIKSFGEAENVLLQKLILSCPTKNLSIMYVPLCLQMELSQKKFNARVV